MTYYFHQVAGISFRIEILIREGEMIKRVAVVEWSPGDGLAKALCTELTALGHDPVLFASNGPIPNDVDMVLTFAPYGELLPIVSQMAQYSLEKRPVFVHWQTQNLPNPHIPWILTKQIAWFRSWLSRISCSPRAADRFLANLKHVQWLTARMYRFRYLGDNRYAYLHGWLDILVESSKIFAQQDNAHGIPAVYIPWGTFRDYHKDLRLERDIDVLWFGKRRIKRRSQLLDAIRHELRTHGIEMYVVDDVEKPFIYGEDRTKILNRSKITLNLRINPYDNVYPYRFHVVAGNRSLIVTEPELDHHAHCIAGRHFIAAEANQIVERILYYLGHEDERCQITENAYRLVTQELTMANSLKAILSLAESRLANRSHSVSTPGRIQRLVTSN
jgi:Glycosyl transferases group 1